MRCRMRAARARTGDGKHAADDRAAAHGQVRERAARARNRHADGRDVVHKPHRRHARVALVHGRVVLGDRVLVALHRPPCARHRIRVASYRVSGAALRASTWLARLPCRCAHARAVPVRGAPWPSRPAWAHLEPAGYRHSSSRATSTPRQRQALHAPDRMPQVSVLSPAMPRGGRGWAIGLGLARALQVHVLRRHHLQEVLEGAALRVHKAPEACRPAPPALSARPLGKACGWVPYTELCIALQAPPSSHRDPAACLRPQSARRPAG